MTNEICDDNRFEIIEAAKQELIRCTNIEMCPDEIHVIDSMLFRLWQMRWLPGQERTCELQEPADCFPTHVMTCSECNMKTAVANYCSWCGSKVVEE